MGLLDGGLQGVFGQAFAPIFLDATIHQLVRTEDEGGSIVESPGPDTACKAVDVAYTETQRRDGGYSQNDVQIIILQKDVGIELESGMEITLRGIRYRVSTPIDQDPAKATWTCRGTPADGG